MTTILVIGATGSIGRHVVGEATASELQVRAVTRDRGRARRMLGDVDLVEGDLTNPASVAPALVGVDAAILTHGGDSAPERVYYGAVAALLDALGDRRLPIALMSSINVTRASGPYTDLMNWKRRGERLLRMSGQPYTIVRPGWFDNISGTVQRLVLQQGDTRAQGAVRCDHVAQALLAAVLHPSAQGRTVEAFSIPGDPVSDWSALFAATHPDTPGSPDGVLDPDNLPLRAEPDRVRADIARFRGPQPTPSTRPAHD